jgi:hypothetical protein
MSEERLQAPAEEVQPERVEAAVERPPRPASFQRAVGAGLGAAAVGSGIYFAVGAATGYEATVLWLLAGFLVGKAVHWGCGGRGGWLNQTLAVGLTYLAIVSTYGPMISRDMSIRLVDKTATPAAGTHVQPAPGRASPQPAPAADQDEDSPGCCPLGLRGAVTLTLVLVLALVVTAPFFGGTGILGFILIAVALFEAWWLNRRPRRSANGPHAVAPTG